MVFQDYELFPHMDVLQNLTLAPVKALKRNKEEVQAEAETLLKRVGLEQKNIVMPENYLAGKSNG